MKTKKNIIVGGSTNNMNNFLNTKRERRNMFSAKKKRKEQTKSKRSKKLLSQIRPQKLRRRMSQISNENTSNNTIIGISDFPSLFDSQNNNTESAIESLSQTNNLTNHNSILSLFSPQTPNSLVENSYRVKNTLVARENFNVLREEIKKSENIHDTMFRYGKPSPLINNFLYSLYNENIICITNNEISENTNYNMMMSVAELDVEPNTLYITISEEPLTPTDKDYYNKMGRLLHMIEIILLGSNYSDKRLASKNAEIIDKDYSYADGRIIILDIDSENIEKIRSTKPYREGYRNFRNKYNYSKTFIPNRPKKFSAKKYDSYRKIIPDNLKIKFVFNTKYILERNSKGVSLSYRPFLKQDKTKKDLVACNSGSICSESKLFSYLHDNDLFSKVKGAIAYWVGMGTNFGKDCYQNGKVNVGICNYHPNYAYEQNEKTKEDLLVKMIEILESDKKISEELLKKKKDKNYKNVFRAFALPCPGCYLNKENYESNNRISWNNSKCLEFNQHKRSDDKMLKKAAELHPGQ